MPNHKFSFVTEFRFGFSPSRKRVMGGILVISEEEIARGLR
jgi:hypothetical protein